MVSSAHKSMDNWTCTLCCNETLLCQLFETLLCQNLLKSLFHILLYFNKMVNFKHHIIFSCRHHKIDHPLTPRCAKFFTLLEPRVLPKMLHKRDIMHTRTPKN